MSKVPARPWGLAWRSHTGLILASVYIGVFSDIFLYCLFVPILPNLLEDRAGLPPNRVQNHVDFMLAAYGGASVVCSPVAGWIADRTASRQLPFLCGLAALLAGTVLLYLAPDEGLMVAARVLQGVSSAVVWSVGFALVMDTVGTKNLGKAVGTVRGAPALAHASYRTKGAGEASVPLLNDPSRPSASPPSAASPARPSAAPCTSWAATKPSSAPPAPCSCSTS